MSALRILHLEDSAEDHALVRFALQRSQLACELALVDRLEDLRRVLVEQSFDIVLADYHLPGFTGLDGWAVVQEFNPDLPFVLLSGAIGEEAAVNALHLGVSDYVLKDSMHRLAHVIQRAMEIRASRTAQALSTAELADSRRRLAALAEHLQVSIEQERADISREIHDDIGGALAAAKLDLSWVNRHTQDRELKGHLDSALEMLQHALEASQHIMKNLRPPILDQGLVAAVQWLGSSVERRHGLLVVVRPSAEVVIVSREVQLVAYRTAQEALTNVIKHAQATTVDIELSDEEGVLTLEVKDNGRGLDSQALQKAHSFGLLGLRERAAKVGGWLDVSSSSRGTSVTLSVPLEEDEPVHRAETGEEGAADDPGDPV
jgi:two-component system, NarL family, sensor histidine kinase UhpB